MSCFSVFVIWTAFQSIRCHRGDGSGVHHCNKFNRLWDWIDIFWVISTTLMSIFAHSVQLHVVAAVFHLSVTDFVFPVIVVWKAWTWTNPSRFVPIKFLMRRIKERERGWAKHMWCSVMLWWPLPQTHSFCILSWLTSDSRGKQFSFPRIHRITLGHGAAGTKETTSAHI